MRLRLLALAAGIALATGPAAGAYNVCVTPADPAQNYGVQVELAGNGNWTSLTVNGQNPNCFATDLVGTIRARHDFKGPTQTCGTVAVGNTAEVRIRVGMAAYAENKDNPVQATGCWVL